MKTSDYWFLSRHALKLSPQPDLPGWQDRLFIGLSRTSNDATNYFQIPGSWTVREEPPFLH